MADENGTEVVGTLVPPVLGKRAALDRLIAQAKLAIWRGVTVEAIVDCLTECGVRMSPSQLRSYLAAGKATGRPPETAPLVLAAGPVSALVPPPRKRGRSRAKPADEVA
jgi:hypothetical protein